MASLAARLEAALPALSAKDAQFASSMLANAARYSGNFTAKQEHWINILIERASNPASVAPEREKVCLGSFSDMVTLFDKGKSRLKSPRIRLNVEGEGEIELSMASDRARYPGTINVTTPGGYGANTWFGRVLRDGHFEISPCNQPSTSLLAMLTAFAVNPAKVAAEYGRKTGRCCFCSRKLTDKRSVHVGYGATCAGNFGLPWG